MDALLFVSGRNIYRSVPMFVFRYCSEKVCLEQWNSICSLQILPYRCIVRESYMISQHYLLTRETLVVHLTKNDTIIEKGCTCASLFYFILLARLRSRQILKIKSEFLFRNLKCHDTHCRKSHLEALLGNLSTLKLGKIHHIGLLE